MTGFRLATKLVLVASSLLGVLVARADAQDADRTVREQTTVIERFEPPPRRPPSVAVTLATPVAGLPREQLEAVRLRLRSIDLEAAVAEAKLDLEGTPVPLCRWGAVLAVRPLHSDLAQRVIPRS